MDQDAIVSLADCDARYDDSTRLVHETLQSPGYHTTLPTGTVVHPTMMGLDYATALLAAGRAERAAGTIAAVLDLQDTEPTHDTYGIWPWYLEESLEEMSPPDWNWADFGGIRLLVIMHLYKDQLPTALVDRIRDAIVHAGEAVFRRNMGPHYTNIAIMSGTVAAVAGEAVGNDRLLTFGREKLEEMVRYTREQGSFNEYNSPAYTMTAMEGCERVVHLVKDPATRLAAEWILDHCWQIIADHWHPATSQWAGPHSRVYHDRLTIKTLRQLSKRLGLELAVHPTNADGLSPFEPLSPIACPPKYLPRFRALPGQQMERRHRFVVKQDGVVHGTTWFDDDACLGSVNTGTFWTQCRALLAYWRTNEEPAATFRPRFYRNGRDFATAVIENTQERQHITSTVTMRDGLGDYHCFLDAPKDGNFHAEDLRLRFELLGCGATARQSGPNAYSLQAGEWEIHLTIARQQFTGAECQVEIATGNSHAMVDLIAYHGPTRSFAFPELGTLEIAFTTELVRI